MICKIDIITTKIIISYNKYIFRSQRSNKCITVSKKVIEIKPYLPHKSKTLARFLYKSCDCGIPYIVYKWRTVETFFLKTNGFCHIWAKLYSLIWQAREITYTSGSGSQNQEYIHVLRWFDSNISAFSAQRPVVVQVPVTRTLIEILYD